ncbi:potassium-transporting ATPase subunit KdpA [Leptospira hartskeerlii]|uniref:Potassium-transporting ATPase potassium-binding subunit n=1 Tax=Leptospira hartskeerlii TaxID=2023177 RepID=A0A2M9X9S9_9LEPT|nr:potassium-transporting ATPase subunit KdpA [Leptospira hartskeerlii]PJZ24457.1 potassium-transporting ATPase subunit KdpA [Leptospira hartskeerlii]PJZ32931.1 potassium-transporting ATPase subunit KdpA [Leptospira hartskeerlii]
MNGNDSIFFFLYFAVLFLLSPFLGIYIADVLRGEVSKRFAFLSKSESFLYKISGIKEGQNSNWKVYLLDIGIFTLLCLVLVVLGLHFQDIRPGNPEGKSGVAWDLAWNTSVSFVTNTNWQAYSGEVSLSYLSQMLLLGVQNFVSAGVGIAVLAAMARGMISKPGEYPSGIGNFYIDLTRSILYILLPISILVALVLVSQGVVMDFSKYVDTIGLGGHSVKIPLGPAASQIAIKQLGTNGGGFFGVNSAHPFENPTVFSSWLQCILILLLPGALPFAYGRWVGSWKAGLSIFFGMTLLFVLSLSISLWSEGDFVGNWEGKETRFGVAQSVLWGMATTAASNGSVNAMHDSFSPLAGGLAVWNILLGEVVFGGVGVGLIGMLFYVVLTVFIAGLMVGRTPEYLGKKIEAKEVKLALVGVLVPGLCILLFTAFSLLYESALSSRTNLGPHGLTEILYAFASASGNNGSAFGGLNANTPFYNLALSFCMLVGRFAVIVPALGLSGALLGKKVAPKGEGTFSTESPLFVLLLLSVIFLVGALTFLPVLVLGPGSEHILLHSGSKF